MNIPQSGRNVNPGALASESAWANTRRNKPGAPVKFADAGDPLEGVVVETGQVRTVTVERQTRRMGTATFDLPQIVEVMVPSWPLRKDEKGKSIVPAWAGSDEHVTVLGGQLVTLDAEQGKPIYAEHRLAWTADCQHAAEGFALMHVLLNGGWPYRTVKVEKELAGRVRRVKVGNAADMPSPDLDEIDRAWRIAENRRQVVRAAAAAERALARSRTNRRQWGTGTVTASAFVPE